jgi:hypothetical protein
MGMIGLHFFALNTKEAGQYIFCSEGKDKPDLEISKEVQFTQFIWLGIDAVSWNFIGDLRDLLHDHGKIYMTQTKQVRYTFELIKTWFTGRDNDKPNIFKMTGDSIFESINRGWKSKKIVLEGELWTFYPVFKPEYLKNVFNETVDYGEVQIMSNLIPHPYYFLTKENQAKFVSHLEDFNRKGLSLFSYSVNSDYVMHVDQRRNPDPKDREMSKTLAKNLAKNAAIIKKFVDEHPNVLFIINTDHGYDDWGIFSFSPFFYVFETAPNGTFCLHGGCTPNNEGWIILYNPVFTPSHRVMDCVDICATISKYLDRVDIPGNSVGRVSNSYENILDEVKVKKQNILQMVNFVNQTTSLRLPEIAKTFLSVDISIFPNNISVETLMDRAQRGEMIDVAEQWFNYDTLFNDTHLELYRMVTGGKRLYDNFWWYFFLSFYFVLNLTFMCCDSRVLHTLSGDCSVNGKEDKKCFILYWMSFKQFFFLFSGWFCFSSRVQFCVCLFFVEFK